MDKNRYNTLIVGGSSSFGYKTAKKLAKTKHNLLLSYYNEEEATKMQNFVKQLQNNFGIRAFAKKLDVQKDAQLKNFTKAAPFPIHNVVYSVSAPVKHVSIAQETWDSYENHWKLQVKGLWHAIRFLLDDNQPLRRIIAIGTIYVFDAPPAGISSYITAKYALAGFMKAAAVEFAPRNITVNIISPGISGKGISDPLPNIMLELVKKQTPLKKLVSPEDVSALIEFLLRKEAGYITGVNIPLAGGLHM